MSVTTDKIAAETAFTLSSYTTEMVVIVNDSKLYEAMDIAENVTLHYENGDVEYSGMSLGEALKRAYEHEGIDTFVYEEAW